jgi:homoserine kinase
MTFVEGPVRVSVPATSANLGPGYDAFGLALDLRDVLTVEVTGDDLSVSVAGHGAADVPLDEAHLVVRALRAGFEAMNAHPAGLRLACENHIPHARGLGSSSAAIVGGIAAARALVAGGSLLLDDHAVFALAADLEGHPDNVAPAVLGGLTIAGREDDAWFAVPASVDPRISTVVFVPPSGVETKTARGLLPDTVSHADAAANAGRAGLLVAALNAQPEHLLLATRDWLHQDFREPAMPDSLALVRSLRADGVPAVVSGAGPTVLAFDTVVPADELVRRCPEGWAAYPLAIDAGGVREG